MRKINWFALAGGIITIIVVVASLFIPWWQISVGELGSFGFSAVFTNAQLLNTTLTIPLVWALNLTSLLALITSGVLLVIYSLVPTKHYSKHLLGYAYKKPLYAVIFFIIPLIAVPLIAQTILNVNIPLNGTSTVALPIGALGLGVTVSFLISARFQCTFWLAITAAALCIGARLYHRKAQLIHDSGAVG